MFHFLDSFLSFKTNNLLLQKRENFNLKILFKIIKLFYEQNFALTKSLCLTVCTSLNFSILHSEYKQKLYGVTWNDRTGVSSSALSSLHHFAAIIVILNLLSLLKHLTTYLVEKISIRHGPM